MLQWYLESAVILASAAETFCALIEDALNVDPLSEAPCWPQERCLAEARALLVCRMGRRN